MITLSSDSGSPYPAAMKGVIAQHSEARLVDVAPGPDRAELVVRPGEHAFVGPDNGVLLPPARELAVDDFGTTVTNIPGDLLTDHDGTHVRVNDTAAQVRQSAAAVEAGKRVVTAGSHGTVELTVNGGRGTKAFSVYTGSDVVSRR